MLLQHKCPISGLAWNPVSATSFRILVSTGGVIGLGFAAAHVFDPRAPAYGRLALTRHQVFMHC